MHRVQQLELFISMSMNISRMKVGIIAGIMTKADLAIEPEWMKFDQYSDLAMLASPSYP